MIVRVDFEYKQVEVTVWVHLGETMAQGDDPDVVLSLQTSLPGGPSPYLKRLLEEQALELARAR